MQPTSMPTTALPSSDPIGAPSSRPSTAQPSSQPSSQPSKFRPIPSAHPSPYQGPPKAPNLLSACFSSDGTSVIVAFDSPTDQAGYGQAFMCSAILLFAGANAFTCGWLNQQTIIAYAPSRLEIGSAVTLRANILGVACLPSLNGICPSSELAPAKTVAVLAPQTPMLPVVSISAPAAVGACSDIVLDTSNSLGSGGRPWKSLTVTTLTPAANASALESYLQSHSSIGPIIRIPSALLIPGAAYNFTVTLCSFLGACNSAKWMVAVLSSDNTPLVSIPGQQQRFVFRNASVALSAVACTQACGGAPSSAGLAYSWAVFANGILNRLLISQSIDATIFRLDPFALNALTAYEIRLTVALRVDSTISAAASVQIVVGQGGLQANIVGPAQRTVRAGERFTLDGSGSTDDDLPLVAGLAAGLAFNWTCVPTNSQSSLLGTCPLRMRNSTERSPIVEYQPLTSAVSSPLKLTLHVAKDSRSDAISAVVTVLGAEAPVITITTPSSSLLAVDASQRLLIQASVESKVLCTARWEVDDNSLVLSALATTPLSVDVAAGSTRAVNLVIAGSSLPVRSRFLLSLTCQDASSAVVVTTNGPPLPGSFTVDPVVGMELTTQFSFSAAQWSDTELPLSYQFGFVSSLQLVMVLQSKSELAHASSVLPSGPQAMRYALTCILQVFDSLGATSTATAVVSVNPSPSSAAAVSAALTQLLANPGNTAQLKQSLATVTAVLNRANCSASPDCVSLHRSDCLSTAHTCGACLVGFVGESGDSNSLCMQASALTITGIDTRAGLGCNRDSDCGLWESCSPQSSCHIISKTCTANCTDHGVCLFSNINSGSLVTTCAMKDVTCSASCACNRGFSGPICDSSEQEMLASQAARTQLISGLVTLTASEDPTTENLHAWVANLAEVTTVPAELSAEGALMIQSLAETMLSKTVSGVMSTQDISSILGAVDSVIVSTTIAAVAIDGNATTAGQQKSTTGRLLRAANSTASHSTASRTVELVSAYGKLASSQLVPGEADLSSVFSTFQLTCRVYTSGDQAENLTVPMTDMEEALGATSSSVVMPLLPDAQQTVHLTTIQFAAKIFGKVIDTSFRTNPLQVHLTSSGPSTGTAGAGTPLRVTLQNNALAVYDTTPSLENVSTACAFGEMSQRHALCSSGFEVVHNCTGAVEVLVSQCPGTRAVAACQGLSSADNGCEVVSFTASATTCACLPTYTYSAKSGSERRLQQHQEGSQGTMQQSGVVQVVGMLTYVGEDFAGTFSVASSMNSVEALQKVLTVLLMFASLWVGGIALIMTCLIRRQYNQKFNNKHQKKLLDKKRGVIMSRSPLAIKEYLTDYVDEIFPAAFRDRPMLHRLRDEIIKHHRYLILITASGEDSDNQRLLMCLQLLSVQTMLCFLLSVFYDVQGADDDGSCRQFQTQGSCLARKSPLDSSQTYCGWDPTHSTAHPCAYQTPSFSWLVVSYIAVIVATATAILNFPIDACFEMLSAPTADPVKVNAADTILKRTGHRMSAAAGTAARRVSVAVAGAARRVSMAATDATAMAAALTNRAVGRRSEVGDAVRKIPETAKTAHQVATASLQVLLPSAKAMFERRATAYRNKDLAMKQRRAELDDEVLPDDSDHDASDSEDSDLYLDVDSDIDSAASDDEKATEANKVTSKTERAEQTLISLKAEIDHQRRFLKPSQIEEFDAAWGLDPTGEFSRREISNFLSVGKKLDSADEIVMELKLVETEWKKMIEKLNFATDAQIGLEILHLFILDMLGRDTAVACIFESKASEDFKHSQVVSRKTKAFACVGIIGLNVFFVYYSVLHGYSKGVTWQRNYLAACIMQSVMEIMLMETSECIWINFFVPDLVASEVTIVVQALHDIINTLCHVKPDDANCFLDASNYLFVSKRVAGHYPDLVESVIVRAYQSFLPGELARKWNYGPGSSFARIPRHSPTVRRAASFGTLTALFSVLKMIGAAPFVVQRVFVRLVQPWILTAITMLIYYATKNTLSLSFAVIIVVALAAFAFYSFKKEMKKDDQRHASVLPDDEIEDNEDDNEDDDDGRDGDYRDDDCLNRNQLEFYPATKPADNEKLAEDRIYIESSAGADEKDGAGSALNNDRIRLSSAIKLNYASKLTAYAVNGPQSQSNSWSQYYSLSRSSLAEAEPADRTRDPRPAETEAAESSHGPGSRPYFSQSQSSQQPLRQSQLLQRIYSNTNSQSHDAAIETLQVESATVSAAPLSGPISDSVSGSISNSLLSASSQALASLPASYSFYSIENSGSATSARSASSSYSASSFSHSSFSSSSSFSLSGSSDTVAAPLQSDVSRTSLPDEAELGQHRIDGDDWQTEM